MNGWCDTLHALRPSVLLSLLLRRRSDGCAAHRADLERRIIALEAAARSGSVSNEGEPPLRPAYADGPDSETEDAAMTLEDIGAHKVPFFDRSRLP